MLYNENKSHCPPCPPPPPKKQAHVHEIQGSVEIAEIIKPHDQDGKKDPCYDEEKKDPCYDYDEEKKDPYYDCGKSKKKPCYDYDEEKKYPCDERKKDPIKHCPKEEGHNHRFALVSGEAIPVGCKDHYHEVKFRTDFYEDHYHVFVGKTGGAITVGDRHVHFLESKTSFNDGHKHDFRVATLIEDPIGD